MKKLYRILYILILFFSVHSCMFFNLSAAPLQTIEPIRPAEGEIRWEWPVPGHQYLSARFADPDYRRHQGIDIVGIEARIIDGAAIYPAIGGIINYVGWSPTAGYSVIIDSDTVIEGQSVITRYFHLSLLALTSEDIGRYVDSDTIIGYVGTTGNSTGPHLHFDSNVKGIYGALVQKDAVDPMLFFAHLDVPMQP